MDHNSGNGLEQVARAVASPVGLHRILARAPSLC